MPLVDIPPTAKDLPPFSTTLKVSAEDWEATPASVKDLIRQLFDELQHLQAEVQQLREQLGKHSQNSSKPPSSDPPQAPKYSPKARTGRPAGGQPGHADTHRPLVPEEQLAAPPIPCRPAACQHCGQALTEHDCQPNPARHQVIDLPPIIAHIREYQRYTASCPHCGKTTQADLPPGVPSGSYGPVVTALVCLLTGFYHLSKRAVSDLMADCFQVPISEASVQHVEQTMSAAMATPWQEVHDAVQTADQANLDETGWNQQRDPDPSPPALPTADPSPSPQDAPTMMEPCLSDATPAPAPSPRAPQTATPPPLSADATSAAAPPTTGNLKKAWLWVAVIPYAIFFVIRRSRGSQVAKEILGPLFAGILNSDRWLAYHWCETVRRQLCWAHLLRDFTAIAERDGVAHRIGIALLAHAEIMFWLWFRVRDGTLTLADFQQAMAPIMEAVEALLKEGADTAGGRTAKTCRWLYAHKEALWTFVHIAGVEPTNNRAEQAIRAAVIWRKLCYGTQTSAGSRYVERILTVVATCRLQQRSVLGGNCKLPLKIVSNVGLLALPTDDFWIIGMT